MDDAMINNAKKLTEKEAAAAWMRIAYYENDEYRKWLDDCKENREFAYGAQYTQDEIDALNTRGQYTVAVNKIRKAVNGIAGLMSANQPKLQVIPVGAADNNKSSLATKIIDWAWGNSGGVQSFRKSIKMAMRDNISYFHVIMSRTRKIEFVVCGYNDIVVDPKSRDHLFRDAEYIYIVKWMPAERVKAIYGITDLVYEIPVMPTVNVTDMTRTLNPNMIFSSDKNYVKVYEGYKKVYQQGSTGEIDIRVVKETLIGFGHMYREELPPEIDEYPIIPIYSEDTDNPYKRGEVHFLKGLQRFINKAHGITLLNAQLMSNPKVFVRQTDIAAGDVKAVENNYARPGSITVLTGNAQEPIIVSGQPLNQAFFTLYQDAKKEFDEATIPRDVIGYSDASGQLRPDRILDIREAVLDSLKHISGNIEAAVSQLGRVVIQYARAYLKQSEVIRITDAESRIEYLKVNNINIANIEDPASVDAFRQQKLQSGTPPDEVETIITRAKEDAQYIKDLVYVTNSVSDLDVDILVVPGSYAPNYEMANLRLSLDLLAQGVIDPQAVLEHAPIENREQILARIDMVRKQSQQIVDLQDYVENLQKDIESANKKLAEAGLSMVQVREEARLDKLYADARASVRIAKNEMKTQIKEIINDVENGMKAKGAEELPDMETPVSQQDAMVLRLMNQQVA